MSQIHITVKIKFLRTFKIVTQRITDFLMGGGRWGVGVGLGGQSGCERRIEVFVKIQ